jgi:hypothetical protein
MNQTSRIIIAILTAGMFITGWMAALSASGQFVHVLKGKLLPWTKAPAIAGDEFRFVVIGDLTGGEEEGVFAAAVEKINQFAPDFVITVGDLIEGYTLDQETIDKYWKSFQSRINRLEAPFFYIPGNHDLSNKLLYDNWMKRFGYDHYCFTIGHSLFIILDTFEPDVSGLSDQQVASVKKALENHNPQNPVYVFSHAPIWNKFNTPGYKELEPLLSRYKTTFFCGHEEHYLFREMNGRPFYMLAKTGGGISQPNINLGDFNHFLFCTAGSAGIKKVANILTDGVIPSDIVNNKTEKEVNGLRRKRWFSIEPSVLPGETSPLYTTRLILRNQGDLPLHVTGKMPGFKNIEISPDSIAETIPAGEKRILPVSLKNPGMIPIDRLPVIDISLTGEFNSDGRQLKADSKKTWIIDQYRICSSDQAENKIYDCSRPGEVDESWCWNGPEDGNFKFSVSHGKDSIYCHIETMDDVRISDPEDIHRVQDKISIWFSPDTSFEKPVPLTLELIEGTSLSVRGSNNLVPFNISGKCVARGNSLVADIRVPKSGLSDDFFRLNIAFADLDDRISTDPSVIWWKPRWGSPNDYRESGIFLLKK